MSPNFIILRGLPGSGKSTLVERLRKYYDFFLIDPDLIGIKSPVFLKFIEKHSDTTDIKVLKFRYCLHEALLSLEDNINVIWAQSWSKLDGIKYTFDYIAKLFPSTVFILIDLSVSDEVGYSRIAKRYEAGDISVSPEKFLEKYKGSFRRYTGSKNVKYLYINGNETVDKSVNKSITFLNTLEPN